MKRIQRIVSLWLLCTFSLTSNAQTLSLLGNHKLPGSPKQAATTEDPCGFCVEMKKPDDSKEVRIDARDGTVYGSTRFSIRDRVKVVIGNKNPFLYEYTINVKADKVSETVFGTFFGLLGGPIPDAVKSLFPAPAAPSGGGGAAFAGGANLCPVPPGTSPDTRDRELKFLLEALAADSKIALDLNDITIAEKLKSLKVIHETVKRNVGAQSPKLSNPGATCQILCQTAQKLLADLQGGVTTADLDELQAKIEELQRSALALKDRVKFIRTRYADCTFTQPIKDFLDFTVKFADGLLTAASENLKAQQIMRDDLSVFAKLKAAVAKARDRNVLQESFEVGPFDSTTEVTIELKRKLLDSKDEPKVYVTVKLKFGEAPFFTVSGGMAFSPLAKNEYGKVLGFARDANGSLLPNQTAPTTVIGLTEQADIRLSPIVMLNGRIYSIPRSWIDGVHLSLGVTAKNTASTTNVEFLIGPSFSFLERNLFLTLGGYVGKQSELAGDLYLGRPVTASDTITVQSNYRWHFGTAITYKIK